MDGNSRRHANWFALAWIENSARLAGGPPLRAGPRVTAQPAKAPEAEGLITGRVVLVVSVLVTAALYSPIRANGWLSSHSVDTLPTRWGTGLPLCSVVESFSALKYIRNAVREESLTPRQADV